MDAIKGFFGGGQSQQQQAESPGLLADWASYQQQADVEAGTAGTAPAAASGQIGKRAEELGGSISSFFRSGYTAVSDGITTIGNTSLENT